MAPSLDLDTPLLTPALQKFLKQLAADRKAGKPPQWYRELEYIYAQVDHKEWFLLSKLAWDLEVDYFALKTHVEGHAATETTRSSSAWRWSS